MSGVAPPTLMHRVEHGLLRAVAGASRRMPDDSADWLGGFLGGVAYRTIRIRRDVVESNLRSSFPDRPPPWIRATAESAYRHFGRELLAILRLTLMDAEAMRERTVVDGLEEMRAALSRGRGAVLVTGHLGNWEIGGAALAVRGVPMDVVAQRQRNPLFDRMMNDARERFGMRVIERRTAAARALRGLRAGRVVAFVADQDARRSGVFVPFFGRPASTHRGPALMALRAGSPLFVGTALRGQGGRYHVMVREVALPAGAGDELLRSWTAEYTSRLEQAVRAAPDQYFWHHRRWKTAPEEPVAAVPV